MNTCNKEQQVKAQGTTIKLQSQDVKLTRTKLR
eukprot:COSAG02_NODE_15732_length_1145_cov_1.955067_3_plen_32_part_01